MDFLKLLDPDVSLRVFKHLDDPSDLVRATAASRDWQYFVIENGLGKQLAFKKYPQLSCVAQVALVGETGNSNDVGSSSSMEWENKKKDHVVYTYLVHQLEQPNKWSCIIEAICASSTDNHPDESIDNTLIRSGRIAQRLSYWSSKGHSDPNVPERLIYRFRSSICLISEIHIRPFQAYFEMGFPTYSSKFVRFRMGHPKFTLDFDLQDVRLDQLTDQVFVWTYTSPEFPMLQGNSLQKFQLPEPALCIGGFMMVELLGRVQRHEMDNLYYICVSHVRADGMSLSPKFNLMTLNDPGKFFLGCNPHAVIDAPKEISAADIDNRTAEAQPHPSWGQFMEMHIMYMLQAYVPGYPNHDVVVEENEDEEEYEGEGEGGDEDVDEGGDGDGELI